MLQKVCSENFALEILKTPGNHIRKKTHNIFSSATLELC